MRLSISVTVWTMTLELARLCGWTPLGTRRQVLIQSGLGAEIDDIADARGLIPWHTEYISNDHQTITTEDGRALAASLEIASAQVDRFLNEWSSGKLIPAVVMRTPMNGFTWFQTPAGKTYLRNLAAFCQRGEFQVC